MSIETQELTADLKAIYGEIFPYRNAALWEPDDGILALGVLLRRELRLSRPITVLPPAFADGLEPRLTARVRGRKGPSE